MRQEIATSPAFAKASALLLAMTTSLLSHLKTKTTTNMKQKLEDLFRQYNIQHITCDSRKIGPHTAFFALKGKSFDGNEFIHEALRAGAIVIAEGKDRHCEEQSDVAISFLMGFSRQAYGLPQDEVSLFHVPNVRKALAVAAGIIYPNLPKNIMAVTGTNGKTSVVSYIYQILGLLGKSAASFGTLGLMSNIPMPEMPLNSLNTPDAITFRKILNELALKGIDKVAFEASSHGIHQHRIGDVKVKTAGFTSFSQDHLDYHLTMEEYLRVKLQLFAGNLEEDAEVVVGSEILESEYGKQVLEFFEENKVGYCVVGAIGASLRVSASAARQSHEAGDPRVQALPSLGMTNANHFINITSLIPSLTLTEINFEYKAKNYKFTTDIIGSFQATNILIAVKMVENLGIDFDQIIAVLPKVRGVAGRLERAGKINDDFHVFIDYAHTPDALEKSLSELKKIKHQSGKLYVVFGCGGDRDHPKRPIMGKIAASLADYVIITDDNPRNEDPATIRADVLEGALGAEEINGREAAIVNTIAKLQKNDILLIAGKGHEDYQIIGDKVFPFSDIEVAKGCLGLGKPSP